ncbi:hypothetical protein K2X14_00010 [Acetobacter sp. TBRC 12305]|uniref:hypothetical protein n=1 Tax=Acetobacter garciniae TaxID=2817435 RepID=UPI001C72FDC4|nr:hypothetical protein [Acetobacter garciniae]MBX0343227.1 hypothetical protein [Acetobacter garciniae]
MELWFNESDKNASFETKLTYECVIFATVVGKDLSLTKRATYMHAKDYICVALELPGLSGQPERAEPKGD